MSEITIPDVLEDRDIRKINSLIDELEYNRRRINVKLEEIAQTKPGTHRPMPDEGKRYYCYIEGTLVFTHWSASTLDMMCWSTGNCFSSIGEAQYIKNGGEYGSKHRRK
jgi:hypothetical protein